MAIVAAKLLIVDDHEPFRRLVRILLQQRADVQIIGESSIGMTAVRKSDQFKPDLILIDLGLPNLTGVTVARLIRRITPESKLLFVGSDSARDVVLKALDTGALAYVHRWRTQMDLPSALNEVLAGKQFVSSGLDLPIFDIFSGIPDRDAVWLEAVVGLSSARERMEAIASRKEGRYFVFSRKDHSILAMTSTLRQEGQQLKSGNMGV